VSGEPRDFADRDHDLCAAKTADSDGDQYRSGDHIALPKQTSDPPNGTTVRTKLRLRNRFPNTAMEIFGRRGKMRVG
jgi:hypothetical protein